MSALTTRMAAGTVLLAMAAGAAGADIPYLSGRVVDDAEILTSAARNRLTTLLREHEQRTTNQIAVLTVPTIQGESIEEYSLAVFEKWKLGQRGKDNGVLVVVVPQDRRMRIEVGYGLEGTLTDLAAARIVRNIMTPRFKENDFDRGVEDGVTELSAPYEGVCLGIPLQFTGGRPLPCVPPLNEAEARQLEAARSKLRAAYQAVRGIPSPPLPSGRKS